MALPKIDTPIYEVELPISKKKVNYRPFLVKEQKILLMASESNDADTIEKAIRQILQNCCLDKIDVDTLSLLDVEYYFLHLRGTSVGEMVENKYRCQNMVNEEVCNNLMETKLDINQLKVTGIEEYKDMIQVTDQVGVKMTLPKYSVIQKARDMQETSDFVFDLIADCIEYIYEGEQIFYTAEVDRSEVVEFLESLSQSQFARLQAFFDSIPKLEKKVDVTCSKCGFNHKIEYEGIESFFG
jgi:hypothetical protein